jgi:hypothetical protein
MIGPLEVRIDGVSLGEEAGRAFWRRFSAWMERSAGDLGGFARSEGLASVRPELHPEGPVLVGSRTAPQGPYVNAAAKNAAAKAPTTGPPSGATGRSRRRGGGRPR